MDEGGDRVGDRRSCMRWRSTYLHGPLDLNMRCRERKCFVLGWTWAFLILLGCENQYQRVALVRFGTMGSFRISELPRERVEEVVIIGANIPQWTPPTQPTQSPAGDNTTVAPCYQLRSMVSAIKEKRGPISVPRSWKHIAA